MLNQDELNQLDATAAMLLRFVDRSKAAGDTDAVLVQADAADAVLLVLDFYVARYRAAQGTVE